MVWLPGDKPQKVTVVYKEVNQVGPGELVGKTDQEKLRKAARDEAESRKEERLLGQVMSTFTAPACTSGMRCTQRTERHTFLAPSCACVYTQGPPSH